MKSHPTLGYLSAISGKSMALVLPYTTTKYPKYPNNMEVFLWMSFLMKSWKALQVLWVFVGKTRLFCGDLPFDWMESLGPLPC